MIKALKLGGLMAIMLNISSVAAIAAPSIEEYVKEAGDGASIVPAGKLKIDGHSAICGHRPTALNPKLDDYGGAFPNAEPGYIILNVPRMKGLPTPVKFYIYSHECGHQMRGHSESGADCFAIKRGVRYGWLDKKGLDQICAFMWDHKADFVHAAGPERCKAMRACFDEEMSKRKK